MIWHLILLVFSVIMATGIAHSQAVQVPYAVELSWGAPESLADGKPIPFPLGYKVWRSTAPFVSTTDDGVTLEATIKPGGSPGCIVRLHAKYGDEFCDDLTGSDKTYFYRITAFYERDTVPVPDSEPSNMIEIDPANPLGIPTGVVMEFRMKTVIMGEP
ncbi:MAG: hypothetical protein ACR2QC_01890 [Gammaproteobacteria bacterium]